MKRRNFLKNTAASSIALTGMGSIMGAAASDTVSSKAEKFKLNYAPHFGMFGSITLTKEGQDAHLYYSQNEDELRCINCHLNVGHYDPNAIHAANVDFGMGSDENLEVFIENAIVNAHVDFTETVPNTTVFFNMKALKGYI
jgi:hypothetical protein